MLSSPYNEKRLVDCDVALHISICIIPRHSFCVCVCVSENSYLTAAHLTAEGIVKVVWLYSMASVQRRYIQCNHWFWSTEWQQSVPNSLWEFCVYCYFRDAEINRPLRFNIRFISTEKCKANSLNKQTRPGRIEGRAQKQDKCPSPVNWVQN